MGLADWTFTGSATASLESVSPAAPVGSKWLHLAVPSGVGFPLVAQAAPKDPPYPHGSTEGRLRSILRYHSNVLNCRFGFACMQSQANLVSGGQAYAAVLTRGVPSHYIDLIKITAGIASSTLIARSPLDLWSWGTTLTLEFAWKLDLANEGGIILHVRLGTATDYSDLAEVDNLTEVVVSTAVLTTTVGESLIVRNEDGGGTGHFYADQTSFTNDV